MLLFIVQLREGAQGFSVGWQFLMFSDIGTLVESQGQLCTSPLKHDT